MGAGNITHIIFDFDGLLVDTEHLYTKASQMMLDKFGLEFTMDIKRSRLLLYKQFSLKS